MNCGADGLRYSERASLKIDIRQASPSVAAKDQTHLSLSLPFYCLPALTMTKDIDTESLWSTTNTLVDVPHLPSSDAGPFHLTLYTAYDRATPDPEAFTRGGFPAARERGQSSTSILPLSSLRKKLALQVPLSQLTSRWIVVPEPANVKEMETMLNDKPSTRHISTLWDWQKDYAVGVHQRPRLSVVHTALYKCLDLRESFAIYPADRVLEAPSRMKSKNGEVKVDMKWASLTLHSPESVAQSNSSPSESDYKDLYQRFPVISPGHQTTAPELLKVRYQPTEASRGTLVDVISHLESRGCLISEAAEDCRPSVGRDDPRSTPRYNVIGLFPKPYLDRLKRYRTKAWKSDVDDNPFIVRNPNQAESAGQDKAGTGAPHAHDLLEGWESRVVDEPFQRASASSNLGLGAGMGAAGGAF